MIEDGSRLVLGVDVASELVAVVLRVERLASGEPLVLVMHEIDQAPEGWGIPEGEPVSVPWRAVRFYRELEPATCQACSGPGGVFGCAEHRPRRQISDRPQA